MYPRRRGSTLAGFDNRWWELYPSEPCPHEPPWDTLVGPALREMPADLLIELLSHLAAVYGRAPDPGAIWIGPSPEEAPYMQRIVTACMSELGKRCTLEPGSLIDYANRYMWNAVDAFRGLEEPSRPAEEPQQPGYEEQHGMVPGYVGPMIPGSRGGLDFPDVVPVHTAGAGASQKLLPIALGVAAAAILWGR